MATFMTVLFALTALNGNVIPVPGTGSGAELQVIRTDSSWISGSDSCSYIVEGVVLVIQGEPPDTLFWVAPLPAAAAPALSASGFSEERTLELVSAGTSWVSARITVRLIHNQGRVSEFTAYRTWLQTGEELDLDKVIQRDALFDSLLSEELDSPAGVFIDSWLWRRGFWFDPLSFLILPAEEDSPVISIGMPSVDGVDTLLTVDFPLTILNTATGSMLD